MGFATGFTGGVTLTLSIAYLSVLAHQRTREEQCRYLRAQTLTLRSLVDPVPPPPPPSRSDVAAAQRAALAEVAKDRWNQEVEKAARWMLNTDWEEVREGLEAHVAALWTKAFGEPSEMVDKASDKLEPLARKVKTTVGETGGGIAAAAQGAFDRARETGEQFVSTVEDKPLEARLAGRRGMPKAESEAKEKAAEAQGVMASALEKGRDKAQELAGKVKSAMGMADAEDKAAAAAAAAAVAAADSKALSPVEKALQQRYETAEAQVNRAVVEVLKERYTPMDERDNTVLRGL